LHILKEIMQKFWQDFLFSEIAQKRMWDCDIYNKQEHEYIHVSVMLFIIIIIILWTVLGGFSYI